MFQHTNFSLKILGISKEMGDYPKCNGTKPLTPVTPSPKYS